MAGYSPMSPRLSSPAHPSSGGGTVAGGGAGRGRGRGTDRRDKELIGQTVRIVQGPYKGRYSVSHVARYHFHGRPASLLLPKISFVFLRCNCSAAYLVTKTWFKNFMLK